MRVKDVFAALERFAPLPLQDDFDNAGLQIGLTDGDNASGVLLCLDVTPAVLEEALSEGCNVVVSHHPLLFKPLKQIAGKTMVERCVQKAISNNIAVYSAHTNLDNARGGVNFEIARRLGLTGVRFLRPQTGSDGGSGVIGELEKPIAADEMLRLIGREFKAGCVCHNELLHRPIKRVALCGGAGDFLLEDAISRRADCFLTGEMHYHVYFGHEQEIQIAVIGHYESEQYTIDLMESLLTGALPGLRVIKTSINTNPIEI